MQGTLVVLCVSMPDTEENKNENQEPAKEENEEEEGNQEEHYEDRVFDIITGVMVEPSEEDS